MGHMLKSRLLASSFANEKQEWQLVSKAMTIDHTTIPRTPTQKIQVSNNHKSFTALNIIHFMSRLQKLLMIHRVCHPAHLQLNTGGFPTKFHASQGSTWQTTLQKLHIAFPSCDIYQRTKASPKKLWRSSKTSAVHQQGLVQTTRYSQRCPISSSQSRSRPMSYMMPLEDQLVTVLGWKKHWGQQLHALNLYHKNHCGAVV